MSEDEVEIRLRALMLASLEGDAAAYRRLLTALGELLRRYYRRRLASSLASHTDDLVQETLMAVHSKRLTYDPSQPLTAWVHAIARYKLIDLFRRTRNRVDLPLDSEAELFAPDEADATNARLDIEGLLGTIPPRPRELIRRVRIEGATIAEAAAGMGMTETAAKVSIHRGLRALMQRFAGGTRDE